MDKNDQNHQQELSDENRIKISKLRSIVIEDYEQNPQLYDENDISILRNSDSFLSRYTVREDDLKTSSHHLMRWLKWRHESGLSKTKVVDYPVESFKIGVLFGLGRDINGNLCLHIRLRRLRKVKRFQHEFQLFTFFMIDQLSKKDNYEGGLTIIYDCKGFQWENLDFELIVYCSQMFIKYFPYTKNDRIIVYEMTRILNPVWNVIKFMAPKDLRQIIHFVYGDEIFKFIDKENLPLHYGGSCKLNYMIIPDPKCLTLKEYGKQKGIEPKEMEQIFGLFEDYLRDAEQEALLLLEN